MSSKYISFDPSLVQNVILLQGCDNAHYSAIFSLSVTTLESGLDRERVASVAEASQFDGAALLKVVQAASILFWEVTKGAPGKDLSSIGKALMVMGLSSEISTAFITAYQENRQRLINLKGALAISTRRYKDFVWRLDVELARRNMNVITQPKYSVRFDFYDPLEGASGKAKIESLHLQADYANLKHMQLELQRAMDELESKHGQRFSKYIK